MQDRTSELDESRYRFQYPNAYGTILYLIICLSWFIYMAVSRWERQESIFVPEIIYIVFSSVICVVLVVFIIRRERIHSKELCIGSHTIIVGSRQLEPSQIKIMMVQGYFKPIVGIKPEGCVVVPYNMVFRIQDQEEKAIKELKAWADAHQVTWKQHTTIWRWF